MCARSRSIPTPAITSIAHWTAVDDFGTVVNPMIVEGQVHGGIAQGVGQAMLENAIYSGDGQLVTGSLMDYTMPRADDLPSFTVGTTMTFCPGNPLGIKGCGEAGAIASPAAVINAITDAIGSEGTGHAGDTAGGVGGDRETQSKPQGGVKTQTQPQGGVVTESPDV